LDAVAEGFLPQRRWGAIPESRVVEFRLEPAASLAGFARDSTGSPIPGAEVYLISPEHVLLDRPELWQTTKSGDDGRFVFAGVPGGTWDLGARCSGFLPAIVRDVEVKSLAPIERDISLDRGRRLRVVVRNAGEDTRVIASDPRLRDMLLPPGGAEVLGRHPVGRSMIGYPVVEDFIPPFELAVPRGPVDVKAADVRRISEPGLGSVEDFAGSDLELTLLETEEVELFVFDASTRQPVDYAVRYVVEGGDDHRFLGQHRGSGRENWKAFVPVDPMRRDLVFEAKGYQAKEVHVPVGHEGVLEVEMVPEVDGETGSFLVLIEPELKPVSRVALVGRNADEEQVWVKHLYYNAVDDEGRWRVEGVPVGTYDVSVLASKRVPGLIERVVVSRNLEQTHRVVLSEGAGMSLRVTDPEGELLDQVHIWLKDVDGRRIDLHILSEVSEGRGFVSVNYLPSAAAASSDSGLAPGVYTITAYREGYEYGTAEFVVREGEENPVTVTLRPR
jgi:hypothetical protein